MTVLWCLLLWVATMSNAARKQANGYTINRPAARWEGSRHSAANAIAAALHLLRSDDPVAGMPNILDMVSICSELVFRATGERIYPAIDAEKYSGDLSVILWNDCAKVMPMLDDWVLVKVEDGSVDVAFQVSVCGGYGGWANSEGLPPGYWEEEIEVRVKGKIKTEWVKHEPKVVSWATLPGRSDGDGVQP